jgi:hypothetical protein
MNEPNAKAQQQIVDKINDSTNILVTVSRDPSVDELSAAVGLTVFLNKLDKHATAIFSGAIPPAITFLEPDKVFENTADSLRDFIIALDKEKADHLRYKVDGDVVKIFITPYKTTISEKDLEFSEGDYNIELVLALGVENQEHLDTALAANGQILHDVTIATLSAGKQQSQLGGLDWRDQKASGQSEMVSGIIDVLKTEKVPVDKQIATALLTGIVSATDRFSNTATTSQVMTLAAQLMAAGADQQLIAAKLQESHEVNTLPRVSVDKIATAKTTEEQPIEPVVEKPEPPKDTLEISHDEPELEPEPEPELVPALEPEPELESEPEPELAPAPNPDKEEESVPTIDGFKPMEETLAEPEPDLTPYIPAPIPVTKPETIEPLQSTLPPAPEIPEENKITDMSSPKTGTTEEPLLGGILNSTSDQAAEDARRELERQQNKTILSHSYLEGSDGADTNPINSATQVEDTKIVDIFDEAPPGTSTVAPTTPTLDVPPPPPPPVPTSTTGLPLPPPLPDFSTLPTEPTVPLTDPNASETLPPTSTLPPSNPNDPSQFQIPTQL